MTPFIYPILSEDVGEGARDDEVIDEAAAAGRACEINIRLNDVTFGVRGESNVLELRCGLVSVAANDVDAAVGLYVWPQLRQQGGVF